MKYFSEDCPADFGVGEALISVGGRRSKLLAVVSSVICGLTFHSDQELQQEDRDAIPEPLTRLTTEDEDETIEERLTGVPAWERGGGTLVVLISWLSRSPSG